MAKKASIKGTSRTGQLTRQGFLSTQLEAADTPDYVVVELRYESPVAYTGTKFAAPAAAAPQADTLNQTLSKYGIASMRSHFGQTAKDVRARIEVASTLPPEPLPSRFAKKGMDSDFIHSGFVQIVPKKGTDAKKLANELNRKGPVWSAVVAPKPVPALTGSAVGSRLFEPSQGYLFTPPDGIGAVESWSLEGANGRGVTICDIEGDWNRRHEDLPTGIQLIGGTVINDIGWRNHGTAVLGEMVSVRNNKGTIGISHGAKAVVHSAVINGVFNAAGAINNAARQLKAGDVILIELHAPGPTGNFVAMQFWDDIFSAIKAAVAKGIVVVEAAGNGNENFDAAI